MRTPSLTYHALTVWVCFTFFTMLPLKEAKANTDTTRGLSIKEVIDMVHNNHPLVISSRMESTRGKATLRKARGAFDPRFQIETGGKSQEYVNQFGNPGKFTYEKEGAHLSLPTRSPVKIESGYESGRGNLVNGESYTLKGGLRYAGISIPVLKGLITDERRTMLAQSKLFKNQSIEIQKIQLLNLSEMVWKDYVLWFIAFQQRNAYATGAQLSLERQEALRELFKAGGCNGMDTLENYIQLELFRTREKEWRVNTTKQRLQLSRHLWNYNNNTNEWSALGISEDTEPSEDFFNYLDSLFLSNKPNAIDVSIIPDINSLNFSVEQQRLNYKLKKWNLLPTFDLKYQQLFGNTFQDYALGSDRRFGLNFSTPLFLRKERGEMKIAEIKWQQESLKYQFKQNETKLKLAALYQQGEIYKDVYEHLKNVENGYLKLFKLERNKFDSGDGTVFLLNTRENRYLNARVKTIEQKSKYLNTLIDYLRATGSLSKIIFGADGL